MDVCSKLIFEEGKECLIGKARLHMGKYEIRDRCLMKLLNLLREIRVYNEYLH